MAKDLVTFVPESDLINVSQIIIMIMAIIKADKKIAIVGIFTLLHEPKKIYGKITLWNIALRRALC